jgi:cytochrome P450
MEHLIGMVGSVVPTPRSWPTPSNLRNRRAIARLDETIFRMIRARRAEGTDKGDLLSMLLSARDEADSKSAAGVGGMDDAQVRDEAMTLFLAGHETTANALAWTFALLSQHPHVERAVRSELTATLQGRTATAADLRALPYLGAVVKESMRLYPPAWLLARRAESEDVLGGVRVPKGSVVLISPYVLHRAPHVWKNPLGFDPERFLAPDLKLGRCDYLPFSAGPRKCIGDGFAMMEAQLVLATLLQRFSFALVPGQALEPEPLITLRPRYGVRMRVSAAPSSGAP